MIGSDELLDPPHQSLTFGFTHLSPIVSFEDHSLKHLDCNKCMNLSQ